MTEWCSSKSLGLVTVKVHVNQWEGIEQLATYLFFRWEIVFSICIRGVHSLNGTPSRITSNNYFEQNYLSNEQNIFISHSQKSLSNPKNE